MYISKLVGDVRETPALMVHQKNGAILRLFCFPYAGGGAAAFRKWPQFFPDSVEVCGVQPPGRENRIGEEPIADVHELVTRLLPALGPWFDKPFVFYGHSTGGLVAFELIRELRRQQMPLPLHLVVSGARAPHISEPSPLHHLPKEAFIQELRRFSGTPESVLENSDLMEIYIPILRADLAIEEKYTLKAEAPINIPITAIYGIEDDEAPKSVMASWKRYTTDSFELIGLPGGHFFINTARQAFLSCLSRITAFH
ncbi:thioesterase II family protein [Desulfobacter sp.]|uniref:thioesterase II family protein n=1 Tax=Desulfobacter sp. TaxID=2294 RepID=UPI003D124C94